MKRNPRVVLGEERHDGSIVNDILSNVYTTVVPISIRGVATSEIVTTEKQVSDVLCADMDETGTRVAFGFASSGFSVWQFTSSRAVELMTETEGNPVKLVRLLPPFQSNTEDRELAHVEEDDHLKAWSPDTSAQSSPNKDSDVNLDATIDLALVEAKSEHIVRLCSLTNGNIVEELALPSVVDDIKSSPRLFAVVLKNHSAHVYLRVSSRDIGTSRCITLPHAHPMVLGMRWIAYGAKAVLESKLDPEHMISPTTSPMLQPQSVWQDLTKTLAVSAFKLGEASTKKISNYLSTSAVQHPGSGTSAIEESTDLTCNGDMIVVRDVIARKTICKISDPTSFLAFDASGSLLVSSSPEGQSLNVFSLPRGILLYRLERGLRPAKITNICFSPDRRWIAATSARGTTHLFPIHPNGNRPTAHTHQIKEDCNDGAEIGPGGGSGIGGWLVSSMMPAPSPLQKDGKHLVNKGSMHSNGQASSLEREPSYMMEFRSEVISTPSLAKISASSMLMPVRAVRFCDKSTIRVVGQNGIVEDYRLVPSSVGEKDEGEKLALDSKLFRGFDLRRDVNETVLPVSPVVNGIPALSGAISVGNQTPKGNTASYDVSVSNFEIQTSREPLVPIWASPQFAMIQADSDNGDWDSMFHVPRGTPIEIRSSTPPPGLADAIHTSAFSPKT